MYIDSREQIFDSAPVLTCCLRTPHPTHVHALYLESTRSTRSAEISGVCRRWLRTTAQLDRPQPSLELLFSCSFIRNTPTPNLPNSDPRSLWHRETQSATIMDPFSITVGVVGLADAGTSLAGFLTEKYKAYRDAPELILEVAHEVEFLSLIHI